MKLKIITADKMQGRPMDLLNEPEDIRWLWDTKLKGHLELVRVMGYAEFKAFVLCGFHEDSPDFIYLFDDADPHYQGVCLEIDLRESPEEPPNAELPQAV